MTDAEIQVSERLFALQDEKNVIFIQH